MVQKWPFGWLVYIISMFLQNNEHKLLGTTQILIVIREIILYKADPQLTINSVNEILVNELTCIRTFSSINEHKFY